MRDFFIQHDAVIKLVLIVGVFASFGLTVFNLVRAPEEERGKIEKQTVQLIEKSVQCGEDCERKITEVVAREIGALSLASNEKGATQCGDECVTKINEIVGRATATLSTTPQKSTTSTTKATASSSQQVGYVAIGGSGTTTNTDWTGLTNTDFFFDIGDYGKVKEARWSINLKLQHGNGEAFVRLYDVTHNVTVPGSELSTKNPSFTLIESSPLTFLSGKNVYRVQIKSLSSFEVSIDGGKIKIISEL